MKSIKDVVDQFLCYGIDYGKNNGDDDEIWDQLKEHILAYAKEIRQECADKARIEILEHDCDATVLSNAVEAAIMGKELL